MSETTQTPGEGRGGEGKGGGRKRKRPYRNRRRNRKPQNEKPESRGGENRSTEGRSDEGRSAEGGGRSRNRGNSRRNSGRGKSKAQAENRDGLDPVKRARRDRRRRKRAADQDAPYPDVVVAQETMPDLEIEPKQVFVYTHVVRPSLRDAYEYRAEHFSQTGRTLDDFRIDLSSILIYPEDNPEGEPVIDLHIRGTLDADPIGDDADWEDDEPLSEDMVA